MNRNGVVKGLVKKVVSAAAGTFARSGSASTADAGIWPIGIRMPVNIPRATPRGTERRVIRHSEECRIRCAIGRNQRFDSKLSRVGRLRSTQARKRAPNPSATVAEDPALLALPVPFLD